MTEWVSKAYISQADTHIHTGAVSCTAETEKRMQRTWRFHPSISFTVLMILTVTYCQENERRAVTEHQLMHDRGRSIQSLKRLIWLSSAIEGLHTAQTRTLGPESEPQSGRWSPGAPLQLLLQPATDSSIHRGALELLLSDMYRPYLSTDTGDAAEK